MSGAVPSLPVHAFMKRTMTVFIVMGVGEGKGKGKIHPRTGHEGPEEE
jgi:hypothetical protein